MKHRMIVSAGVFLAVLISAGFAFAANSGHLGNPNPMYQAGLPRCATVNIPIFLSNSDPVGAWGLPIKITGGATILAATPDPSLAGLGFTTATGGFPGTSGVLNMSGGCLPPGAYSGIWTLTVQTPSACTGTIEIDTAFFPPAGAYVALGCGCCPITIDWVKGSFSLENQPPICGTNSDETVNFAGSIAGKQLNASDPDACDALTYAFVSASPALTGAVNVTPAGVFSYSATCADKGAHVVTFSATDGCGGTVNCTFNLTVTNTAPTCGTNTNENVYFQAGVVNKQLNASDANGNPLTYSLVSVAPAAVGTASVSASGVFNYATVCGDVGVHTVTFRASDGCDFVDCTFQVTVFQNAPVATCPSDASVDWDAVNQVYTLNATDDGCHGTLTWSLVSAIPAPTNAPTVSAGGLLTFNPACADVALGPIALTVQVSDGEKTANCSFNVTVTNAPPTITCPADFLAVLGDLVGAQVNGSDPAGNALTFSLVSFTGLEGQGAPHNAPSVSASGAFSWQTSSADNNDAGAWEVCVMVQDGCGGSAQCCFQIEVLSYALCVRSLTGEENTHILNGQDVTVYVTLSNTYPLGGIDLLLCYDPSGLSFFDAFPVDELANWEYFTWRHSPASNCVGGCPSGYIRVVAIADLDNGPANHPDNADFYLSGNIVGLKFHVTSDRNFINQCFNIGFCVLDCGDNSLSSKSGDTLFIPIGSPTDCIDPTKLVARDIINFCPGRICVDEPPDDRGDENLNGIANEVGDVVLFTNYFVYGPSVWDPVWKDVQILATDINDDGVVLTVADLIYQIRIITGDAQPFPANPKLAPYANSATATLRVENGNASVSTSSSVDLGGAMFTFRYSGLSVGTPTLTDAGAGMIVASNASNGELRVLVRPSWEGHAASIGAGSHELLSIPTTGDGTLELVDVQMSDAQGALMSTASAKSAVPTEYALHQNYPNPFNAGTVMSFDLKEEAAWSLVVYNIAGQTVREFAGHNGSGAVSIAWDGRDNAGNPAASGVYFYRVTANGFNATKKMTLVK